MHENPVIAAHLRHLLMRGLSPNTIRARRSVLTMLAGHLDPVTLLAARPPDLLDWRAALTVDAGSIAGYLSHVRGLYAWAADEGLRPDNPAARIPSPRKPDRLPRPVSEADLMAALAAADGRVRAWIVLQAWAGLRACEVAGLRVRSIVLTGPDPHILVAADATKGHRERRVPLCPFAVGELLAYGLPASGWAFRRLDGKPGHPQAWTVSQAVSRHFRDCGISATGHQNRHFFGSEFYALDNDLLATAELMGHQSTDSTRGYVRICQDKAAAAVARLPVPPSHLRAAG
jgi:integrase